MSWWIGKTRDEFRTAAAAERERIEHDGNRPVLTWEANMPSREVSFIKTGVKPARFAVARIDSLQEKRKS
jgi:hypothetical protein